MNKSIGIMLAGDLEFPLDPIIDHFQITNWIAVDGGYDHLYNNEIIPEIVIGDFDSTTQNFPNELRYNPIKDDTDFALAIDYVERNYHNVEQIIVCGVIADQRIEHFIANLKLMTDKMIYVLKNNLIYQYPAGNYKLKPVSKQFSLFAKENVPDLTIKNAKWELNNYNLTTTDPLTISNEFLDDELEISFSSGIIQFYINNIIL